MTKPENSTTIQRVMADAANALRSGNLKSAEIALAPIFRGELHPNPELLNIAGTLRMNQGRLEEAAALFVQAAIAAPDEPIFSYNPGLALSRLGRHGQAETALRTTLRYRPDFVQALFELGAVLHRLGRLEEAEKNIRGALRHTPGNAHAELALAALLVDDGRPSEAEMAARRGLELAA